MSIESDLPLNDETPSKYIAPLADRMRPRVLSEMAGQKHILGEGKPLRRMIERDLLNSLVLNGPPGVGKSTLADIITSRTHSSYIRLNAVLSNIKELREAIEKGRRNMRAGRKTILYLDEIHRFNKSQQDALLPALEEGSIILIGSTTQNPYFYLTNALLSRVTLFTFDEIDESEILILLKRAIKDKERGLGNEDVEVTDNALKMIAQASLGDARKALSFLEFAVLSAEIDESEESLTVSEETVKEIVQKKAFKYDGGGDEHYDIISAFIKSVRGSDADSAIYYLARMLESGEEPRFIARRLAILAAEDIGLANTNALNVASSMVSIIDFIGMPEARIVLSECTIYLALSAKSNSAYLAIDKALNDVRTNKVMNVPTHLKDPHTSSFKQEKSDYLYPHDYPYHVVKQEYTSEKRVFYTPCDIGEEKELKRRLEWIRANIYGEKN